MNGEEFVKNFQLSGEDQGRDKFMLQYIGEKTSGERAMDTILRRLYLDGEVEHQVQDGIPTVGEMAVKQRQRLIFSPGETTRYIEEFRRQNRFEQLTTEDDDPQAILTLNENSSIPIDELTDIIIGDIAGMRMDEVDCMVSLLAQTLSSIERQRQKNGDAKVSESISNSISTLRKSFIQRLPKWDLVLEVNRVYSDRTMLSLGVDTVTSASKTAPAWYKYLSSWIEPLHYVCSLLSDLDAFVALQEWVIVRGLPYLPIIAPPTIETGRQSNGSARNDNLHAHILLCSMDKNDVMPIQFKTAFNAERAARYHSDMQFIVPSNLGSVDVQNEIVKTGGTAKTGRKAITRYGDIYHLWVQTYRAKPNQRQLATLKARLAEPFLFFDENLLPKLKH